MKPGRHTPYLARGTDAERKRRLLLWLAARALRYVREAAAQGRQVSEVEMRGLQADLRRGAAAVRAAFDPAPDWAARAEAGKAACSRDVLDWGSR